MSNPYRDKLLSVGVMKSGRTKHNQAGVPIVESSDTKDERTTVDVNGAVYKDKADGTQDLTLNPKPVEIKMTQPEVA